jgi:hypothetical protein
MPKCHALVVIGADYVGFMLLRARFQSDLGSGFCVLRR